MMLLEQCLQMFTGISPKRELGLYKQGISDWEKLSDYLKSAQFIEPSFPSKLPILKAIQEAQENFEAKAWQYFTTKLPSTELWRLFELIPDQFVFLDIETNGLNRNSFATVVTLYRSGNLKTAIRGRDLEFLFDDWNSELILVTYNGKRFDIPFLEKEFHLAFPNPHLDLMNVLHGMGIKGGLKKSEEILLLPRDADLQGIDGSFAPKLWEAYTLQNDSGALEKLVQYNQADVVQLEKILKEVMRRKRISEDRTYTL